MINKNLYSINNGLLTLYKQKRKYLQLPFWFSNYFGVLTGGFDPPVGTLVGVRGFVGGTTGIT